MLIVHEKGSDMTADYNPTTHQLNSGITPSTKNIRKRKFKKPIPETLKYNISLAENELLKIMKKTPEDDEMNIEVLDEKDLEEEELIDEILAQSAPSEIEKQKTKTKLTFTNPSSSVNSNMSTKQPLQSINATTQVFPIPQTSITTQSIPKSDPTQHKLTEKKRERKEKKRKERKKGEKGEKRKERKKRKKRKKGKERKKKAKNRTK